ncbi:putative mfs [Phaeomoniella chlamydospora]|uniref:Putative mfs n=1 Tax=Phaeomoniella chlamydospora TaxID=158046 RepID=A0A0G2DVI6_PHACM|nr:putative mfs [Phaeomoniella chlamydospora]
MTLLIHVVTTSGAVLLDCCIFGGQVFISKKSMAADLPQDEEESEPFLPGDSGVQEEIRRQVPSDRLRWRVIFTALALILFSEIAIFMHNAPFVRIFEDITCRRWYAKNEPDNIPSDGRIPEEQCKNEAIQSEVAIIRGFEELFDGLVGLACAIPYGNLADKIGRKPVFILSIPAVYLYSAFLITIMWFELPLRLIWISALFFALGGGPPVIIALVWTIVADVANEEQRSTAFMQIGVVSMAAEFVAGAVSGYLTSYNPWLAMFVSLGLLCASVLIILLFPETKGLAIQKGAKERESHELDDLGVDSVDRSRYPMSSNRFVRRTLAKLKSIRQESGFILDDSSVFVLLLTFFVYKISRGAGAFFVQYISKRYGWTIAHANYLTSVKAFFNIFLFTTILPYVASWLGEKKGIKGNRKEFILAKVSIILLFIGTVGQGLAPNIVLLITFLITQTMGAGFAYQIRAIITSLVQSHQVARLYVGITILETAGHLAAGPVSAGVFKWGLQIGGPWVGLPYLLLGSTFLLAAFGTWWVSWQRRKEFAM